MQQKFFKTVFASAGDVAAVPNPVQGDGSLSYTQGYGPDYQLDPTSDPAALKLQRAQWNQLLKDMTGAIQGLQIAGYPEFITAADNGGVAFPYPINAYVRFDTVGDGTGWAVFASTANNNNTIPLAGGAHWTRVDPLNIANITAPQADVNEGDDDSEGLVGPVELVKAAREGRWTYAGAAVYADPNDLTAAMPGTGAYLQVGGAEVVFTVPAANTVSTLTFKLGPNAVKPLRTSEGDELQPGDLQPGANYHIIYTGAEWRIAGVVPSQLRKFGSTGSGAIYGLQTAPAAGALTTAISIGVGNCRDTTNAFNIALAVPFTKHIDAPWALGSGNGMRDTGALAANQTWHVFVIMNPLTGVVDVLASQSATAPVLPAGFTVFRRIWSLLLDAANGIRGYLQTGNYCSWLVPVNDYAATLQAGVNIFTLRKVSVPNGIKVLAKFYFQSTDVGGAPDANAYLSGLCDPDQGPPPAYGVPTQWAFIRRGWFYAYPGQWLSFATAVVDQWCDKAQNIYTGSNDAFDTIALKVIGYVDQRNQFF